MRIRIALLAVLLVAAPALVPAAGAQAGGASCAPADQDGGSWPSLNHDLRNTRNQPDEDVIGPGNAADLSPDWTFDAAAADPDGDGESLGADAGAFQSTPIVANGCLFVASSTGWIFALNADSGELVWAKDVREVDDVEVTQRALLGLAAAKVRPGSAQGQGQGPPPKEFVFAHFSPAPGRFWAVALDQDDGDIAWSTRLQRDPPLEEDDGNNITASPVVHEGVMFVPVSGGFGEDAAVPLFFVDALDGTLLDDTVAIPADERQQGYGGAGAWSSAAVDTEKDLLYVGTADSEAFKRQHRYNGAILKIDFDKSSDSFGEVLDAYQGTPETYVDVPFSQRNPVCEEFGDARILPSADSSTSTECAELDLDIGASPNLFRDADGRLLVGAIEKSGVYHAAFTDTMTASWRRILSGPASAGNASTATFDGTQVVASANPSTLHAMNPHDGFPSWISSTGGDVLRYQPMTSANGVVYTVSIAGVLTAHESATGVPLTARSIAGDVGEDQCVNFGGGVSVARNSVYVQCDSDSDGTGWIVSYDTGGGA